eukprot:15442460-Alexandrium_andersonii.AAC.1
MARGAALPLRANTMRGAGGGEDGWTRWRPRQPRASPLPLNSRANLNNPQGDVRQTADSQNDMCRNAQRWKG